MENFVVSARKYRPATFDMVVGQASITNTLKNAIKNDHLAQAFLFCGPRGVGKTTCARIMAKTINCENLTETIEACNECKSCLSFNESNSFNVHELDAASNNSVDDIRNLVDQVRIPPHIGKYKVYVIDEVHMLSQQAFNAFLKTLEEPPAYAKFILATTEKHKIIPTILSRCQIFDFARITIDDIARQLEFVAGKESIETEYEALHVIAQKADGAMRDALSIFDQIVSFAGNNVTYRAVVDNLNVLDYDYFFNMIDHILAGDTSKVLLLYNQIIEKGFEGSHFISGFASHMRNLLVCKDPKTVKLMDVGENIRQKYTGQSAQCPPQFLLKALDIANRCDISYRTSNNKRLHVELALLQISGLLQQADPAGTAPQTHQKTGAVSSANPAPTQTTPQKTQSPSSPAKAAPSADSVHEQKSASEVKEPARPSPSSVNRTNKPPSIKINPSASDKDEKKKDELTEPGVDEPKPEEQFTSHDLLRIWEKLKEKFRNSSASIFTALNTYEPEIKESGMIQIKVNNLVQKESIFEQKPEMLSFLRQNLKNYAINFEVVIVEVPKTQKAYLPAEKLQKMLDKNPQIEKLKNDLDLDLIY